MTPSHPSSPPPGRERRSAPRVRLSVDVDFTSEHNFYSAKTRDISTGGLFIETEVGLPIGTTIQVDLRFLRTHAVCMAEVVWALVRDDGQTEGLGVRFVSLPKGVAERIEAFMGLREEMRVGLVDDDEPEETEQAPKVKKGPPPLPQR